MPDVLKEPQYGVYDTVDDVWYGDDGPKLFDNEQLARAAAQILDVMLQQTPGRTRARLWPGGTVRLKDEKKPAMTALAALRHIEKGGL